jgi:hypothetical protein
VLKIYRYYLILLRSIVTVHLHEIQIEVSEFSQIRLVAQ